MKKLNLQDIYELGKRVAPLGRLSWETKLGDVAYYLWSARNVLEAATSDESPMLEVTKRAGRAVVKAISDVLPDNDFSNVDKDKVLNYEGYAIGQAFQAFESVLANEMPGAPAFVVSQKGIFRTQDLIERATNHFPPEVKAELPNQARIDFCEAGKCLAFELSTACSFHLWRALETVIDAYYARLTSSSFEADKVQLNWGAKIKALEQKGADKAVTKYLDHIREQYRNPQTHPEEVVQLSEAQMLFGTASSSITQMILEIKKLPAPSGSVSALAVLAAGAAPAPTHALPKAVNALVKTSKAAAKPPAT